MFSQLHMANGEKMYRIHLQPYFFFFFKDLSLVI